MSNLASHLGDPMHACRLLLITASGFGLVVVLPLLEAGIHVAGGDSQDRKSCKKGMDKGTRNNNNNMKLTTCEDNGSTLNIVLQGRAPSMRQVARTHRVNPPWLYDDMQTDGNISIKRVNAKQQCAGVFAKGFTSAEMWKALMPNVDLFDMNHQKLANNSAQTSCIAMPSRDARIAMEMLRAADEESGLLPHDMPQHSVGVTDMCMIIGHYMSIRRLCLPKEESY